MVAGRSLPRRYAVLKRSMLTGVLFLRIRGVSGGLDSVVTIGESRVVEIRWETGDTILSIAPYILVARKRPGVDRIADATLEGRKSLSSR
jgi:hypothetical protein